LGKKINILVVHNERIIDDRLEGILSELDYHVVSNVNCPNEALNMIECEKIDLAILDINLKGGGSKGVELAHRINEAHDIPFVYLTSYSDVETIDAVKNTYPGACIVKPFSKEDLYSAIEITLANIKKIKDKPLEINTTKSRDFFFYKTKGRQDKIAFKDILWVESANNYIVVKCSYKKFVLRETLEHFTSQLPANRFIRTHRSFAVQIDKIDTLNKSNLVIADQSVPVSRKYRSQVLKELGLK